MNKEQAEQTAWKILGEVEEMMSSRGVGILSDGPHRHPGQRAFFEDREYQELEATIVGILTMIPGRDDAATRYQEPR